MAASRLPKPGSKLGPCKRCEHRDCAELRNISATVCFCGKPVGYEARFYRLGDTYVHADCEEDRNEQERAALGR